MGYTHYWRKGTNNDQEQYSAALDEVFKMLRKSPVPLTIEVRKGGDIFFNGAEGDDYETFYLPADITDLEEFAFCKTALRPYDTIVVAALCVIDTLAPGVLDITSDGTSAEWMKGQGFACHTLEQLITVPNTIEDH